MFGCKRICEHYEVAEQRRWLLTNPTCFGPGVMAFLRERADFYSGASIVQAHVPAEAVPTTLRMVAKESWFGDLAPSQPVQPAELSLDSAAPTAARRR